MESQIENFALATLVILATLNIVRMAVNQISALRAKRRRSAWLKKHKKREKLVKKHEKLVKKQAKIEKKLAKFRSRVEPSEDTNRRLKHHESTGLEAVPEELEIET